MRISTDKSSSGKSKSREFGNIVPIAFTPVLPKHTKSFNLVDTLSVGVDRIQRNFEPMPAARSGLRSPQSDASYASRRIAANLRLIVDGAYGCCSSAIRYRVTTVLLKASLGSERYQSMNSRMAWSYERFELEDVRLLKTADFDCSRSGNLRTVFGTRLRLLFAIWSGLQCRGEKRDPVPDLLTSGALVVTGWRPARRA